MNVKHLTNAFSATLAQVGGEINTGDVLLLTLLEEFAPETLRSVRREPSLWMEDTEDVIGALLAGRATPEDRRKKRREALEQAEPRASNAAEASNDNAPFESSAVSRTKRRSTLRLQATCRASTRSGTLYAAYETSTSRWRARAITSSSAARVRRTAISGVAGPVHTGSTVISPRIASAVAPAARSAIAIDSPVEWLRALGESLEAADHRPAGQRGRPRVPG